MKNEYPEIERYSGMLRCGLVGQKCSYLGSIYDDPEVSELLSKWGDPKEVRGSLHNLEFFAWFGMHPKKVYIWEKGKYKIECVINHPAAFNWRPHLHYCDWYILDNPACIKE